MRLTGFTRMGAVIGFLGAIAIMLISTIQFESDEVSRKDVLLAEVLFGIPIFTIVGAALGAGWDFYEKRSARAIEPPEDTSGPPAVPETTPTPDAAANSSRRRRRNNPPGGRRKR